MPDTAHHSSGSAPDSYRGPSSPASDSYSGPASDSYGGPASDSYNSPASDSYNSPASDNYDSPANDQLDDYISNTLDRMIESLAVYREGPDVFEDYYQENIRRRRKNDFAQKVPKIKAIMAILGDRQYCQTRTPPKMELNLQ